MDKKDIRVKVLNFRQEVFMHLVDEIIIDKFWLTIPNIVEINQSEFKLLQKIYNTRKFTLKEQTQILVFFGVINEDCAKKNIKADFSILWDDYDDIYSLEEEIREDVKREYLKGCVDACRKVIIRRFHAKMVVNNCL